MSLLRFNDEAALRALDRQCAVANSVVSERTVRQIAAAPLEYKEAVLINTTIWGLGNLVRCALEAQASPNETSDESTGCTPLLSAAGQLGHTSALKSLLAGGANIELADNTGLTALAAAARQGQLSCVQLLLDAGANANTQDDLGNTPLMEAVMYKHVECARALLPASNLALADCAGNTAFHAAVMTASEACFELLLPLHDVDVRTVPGVDVTTGKAVPIFNKTVLHIAGETGHLSMIKALLSRGADRMARDTKQRMLLHYAAARGHLSCVTMLIGRPGKVRMTPAEVDAADGDRATALYYAAQNGVPQICAVLLEAGARLDAKSSAEGGSDTPLTIAKKFQPTNAALHALLSGDGPARPPSLVCDHCALLPIARRPRRHRRRA